jgi:hypothetical protein
LADQGQKVQVRLAADPKRELLYPHTQTANRRCAAEGTVDEASVKSRVEVVYLGTYLPTAIHTDFFIAGPIARLLVRCIHYDLLTQPEGNGKRKSQQSR